MLMQVFWSRALASSVVSPYEGLAEDLWVNKTVGLVDLHPLESNEIVEVVLGSVDI
jgi:hypothetical protein